ncbi:MAG: polysaccharide biosynthesis protein, partial [Clostridia bacterium]|nr:polysaccharide biosynthesis protein [Clostridia bacterium]
KKRVVRDFGIEDLLFRKEHDIEDAATVDYYNNKTVLVTGGGGSIGSELCRQIAKCGPKKLIILDIYENNAYDIQQELIRKYGNDLDLSVEIASVRDRQRLDSIFNTYRPDVVFHAAAHKHVPLMECSACEAIKNNVVGTYNTADMAEKYGAAKFIMISTDKAVNPTNIMGASKRICEMIVQCRKNSPTSFAAVRFGNVLGSNGSVIPLFKKQIAAGGPVTITDKRIIRYFMTITEASQLVMQAGAMAKSGELFVLDMGKPVKIYDLAVNMIKLSGYTPEVDIKIHEIGLRPGEKLYEELLMKSETLDKTSSDMIFIERDTPLSRRDVDKKLDILSKAVELADNEGDMSAVRRAIIEVVPTFRDAATVNKNAEKSDEMKRSNESVNVTI